MGQQSSKSILQARHKANKKPSFKEGLMINPGNDLFSQNLAVQVFSALERFTSEFGMESGSATPLQSPGIKNGVSISYA